uniref:hypothetical protein n=1 Tax=Psychrobacter glacincola TaxID=56810 RepID=UPI0039AF8CD2
MQNVNEYLRENLNKVGGSIYIAPNLPEKKVSSAISEFKYDSDTNSIVALYDNSLLGNSKEGLLFVGSGFFIK